VQETLARGVSGASPSAVKKAHAALWACSRRLGGARGPGCARRRVGVSGSGISGPALAQCAGSGGGDGRRSARLGGAGRRRRLARKPPSHPQAATADRAACAAASDSAALWRLHVDQRLQDVGGIGRRGPTPLGALPAFDAPGAEDLRGPPPHQHDAAS
jgi:hypothetical protein